jgi:hypothetical protein
MRAKPKAIFKLNGGLGALLCSGCAVIIKIGRDFTPDEHKALKGYKRLEPQFCNNCKDKFKTTNNEIH